MFHSGNIDIQVYPGSHIAHPTGGSRWSLWMGLSRLGLIDHLPGDPLLL